MEELSRRRFLKNGGAAVTALAGTGLSASLAMAGPEALHGERIRSADAGGQMSILFDSTLCIGCKACELACNDANELGRTPEEIFQGCVSQDYQGLSAGTFTCVTQHSEDLVSSGAAFGRAQCMHCLDPACASACPVGAMEKTPEGPVVWHPETCLGCRYCMMACPFEVPRFEWDSVNPRIRKCSMCFERTRDGGRPACVEICPSGALSFGPREDLLLEAHRRIDERPRGYVHHVYGETEAGGTNLLHIAAYPFTALGYKPDVPDVSPAAATRPAMGAIPFAFNGLALFLGASAWLARRKGRLEPLAAEEER